MKNLIAIIAIIVGVGACAAPTNPPSEVRGATATRGATAGDISAYAAESEYYIMGISDELTRVSEAAGTGDTDYATGVCESASATVESLWADMPDAPDEVLQDLIDGAVMDTLTGFDACADGDFDTATDALTSAGDGWQASTERVRALNARAGR